jgi:hypothetical protein
MISCPIYVAMSTPKILALIALILVVLSFIVPHAFMIPVAVGLVALALLL